LKGKEISAEPLDPSLSQPIKADGILGEVTERELKKIQEKLNIEQTGEVSEELNKKMQSLLTQILFKNEGTAALKK
jgi:uncharacterized FlaG/YvyC family protein